VSVVGFCFVSCDRRRELALPWINNIAGIEFNSVPAFFVWIPANALSLWRNIFTGVSHGSS
jgi:hypothetical protein